MSSTFNKQLLTVYLTQAEKTSFDQTNMWQWINIYNTYSDELKIDQKMLILKQLLICATNREHNVDDNLNLVKIINQIENDSPLEITKFLDNLMLLKETENILNLKLTALFYFKNISDNLNKYDILKKSIKKSRTRLYIPRKMWRVIWPQLNNISDMTQRQNIIAIAMDSNIMIGETNSNTTEGIYDMLSNFNNSKLQLDQTTLDKVWNIILKNCKGSAFEQCVLKSLSRVYDTDYIEHAKHINALIRTNTKFISTFSQNLLWQHKESILPRDILLNFENISIKDANAKILYQAMLIYPPIIDKVQAIRYHQIDNTAISLIQLYINTAQLDELNIIDLILNNRINKKELNLDKDDLTNINEQLYKHIQSSSLTQESMSKIKKVVSLSQDNNIILKHISTELLCKLTSSYQYLYDETEKNFIIKEYAGYHRRLRSGPHTIKIINPEQLEFQIVSILAPDKLESLKNEWIRLIESNAQIAPFEDVKNQDNFFFMWLQKELLHKEPITIGTLGKLQETLGTHANDIIKSWACNVSHEAVTEFNDMDFILD